MAPVRPSCKVVTRAGESRSGSAGVVGHSIQLVLHGRRDRGSAWRPAAWARLSGIARPGSAELLDPGIASAAADFVDPAPVVCSAKPRLICLLRSTG